MEKRGLSLKEVKEKYFKLYASGVKSSAGKIMIVLQEADKFQNLFWWDAKTNRVLTKDTHTKTVRPWDKIDDTAIAVLLENELRFTDISIAMISRCVGLCARNRVYKGI